MDDFTKIIIGKEIEEKGFIKAFDDNIKILDLIKETIGDVENS